MPTPDNATWFHSLAEELGRVRKLEPVIVQDGPNAFRARYGSKANGKPLYELFVDFVAEHASLLCRDVPYAAGANRWWTEPLRPEAPGS